MDLLWILAKLILAAALLLSSHASVLEVTIPEVEIGKTANVSLKCSTRYPQNVISEILAIRILKWGHDEWNRVAELRGGETEIRQKPENVLAEGSVTSATDSFLHLTWRVATNNTMGQYRCDVIGYTFLENVSWHKSLSVFITSKREIDILTQTVEKYKIDGLYRLRLQRQVILENLTTTVEALEASFENKLKKQQQVLSYNLEESKRECLEQKQDMLKTLKAMVEERKGEGLRRMLSQKQDILEETKATVKALENKLKSQLQGQSCADVQGLGPRPVIRLYNGINVVCDTVTDKGGWIVIQRRASADVSFSRGWEEYKNGFGDLSGNFWLGLEKVHQLLNQGKFELRFDFAYKGTNYYANYDNFVLSGEAENYKIELSGFSGNEKDNMAYHNGQAFSTKDRDNDSNELMHCAKTKQAGWWYNACHEVNFNGKWGSTQRNKGLNWVRLTTRKESVTFSEMKIRPLAK